MPILFLQDNHFSSVLPNCLFKMKTLFSQEQMNHRYLRKIRTLILLDVKIFDAINLLHS
jgi:hypothetical protein